MRNSCFGRLTALLLSALLLTTLTVPAQTLPAWRQAESLCVGLGHALATDAAGNVYVAGEYYRNARFGSIALPDPTGGLHPEVYVAKMSPGGTWRWAVRAGGSNGLYFAAGLAVDTKGHVYITGSFRGTATFGATSLTSPFSDGSPFVARLDTAGTWQWAVMPTGAGFGNGLKLDASGNPYVTGAFGGTTAFGPTTLTSAGSNDIFVAKLNPAGTWLWAARAGGSGDDYGKGLALDGAGNVYATGQAVGTATFGTLAPAGTGQVFVAKLAPTGAWQWAVRAGSGAAWTRGQAVVADAAGGVFVAGACEGAGGFGAATLPASTTPGNPSSWQQFVGRLNAAGTWGWVQGWDTDASAVVATLGDNGLVLDAAGNAVLTGAVTSANFGGTVLNSAGRSDVLVAAISAAGAWQWAARAGSSLSDTGSALALDPAGNVLLTGSGQGGAPMRFGLHFLADRGGAQAFVARLAVPSALTATASAAAAPAFACYPNPARTAVQLSGATGTVAVLRDALGREVLRQPLTLGAATLAVRGLPAGLYAVQCGGATRRLVVE